MRNTELMTRRQALRLMAGAAATATAAGLLAACGGSAPAAGASAGGNAGQTVSSAASPAAGSSSQAAPAAAQGTGQVVIAQEADPVSLDVSKAPSFSALQATEFLYDSLAYFDANMQIQPALAESWDTPDPTTYVFHLRKGVKWHNGRDFVASDVAYWQQRMMDPKTAAPYKSSFAVIKQLDVVDDHTVKMTLSKPDASLLADIASLRGSAIPNKETVEKYGDLATHAIGTGPYKLADYAAGDYVRYTRNPDYWMQGVPHIEQITLKLMVDEDQRIAALRSGQVALGSLSSVGGKTLASDKNVTVLRSPKAWLTMVLFNSQRKPFDDVRVRKAISMAIDRNAFIQKVVQGDGVLSGPVPTGFGDWFIPPEQLPYKQDIPGAKKLLADAGYPNGFKATIRTTSTQYPELGAIAVEMKSQLTAVGIDLTVDQREWGELLKYIDAGADPNKPLDYDMITPAHSFFSDPDSYLGHLIPERNFFLRSTNTAAKDPQITQDLDKAESITDHDQRKQLYLDAQQRMLNDQIPALFIYAGDQIDGVSNRLKGYKQSFTGRRYLLDYATYQ